MNQEKAMSCSNQGIIGHSKVNNMEDIALK